MRRLSALGFGLSALGLFIGCSGAGGSDGDSTPASVETPSAQALTGFSLDAQRAEDVGAGDSIPVLRAVRTGRHEGYERIAFEFSGRAPGYRAEYLSGPAIQCGSGDTTRVEGSVVLAISFSPTDAHVFDGEQARSSIPERTIKPDLGAVREMKLTCDFEAEVAWAIGLDERRPMRVGRLPDRPVVYLDFAPPR